MCEPEKTKVEVFPVDVEVSRRSKVEFILVKVGSEYRVEVVELIRDSRDPSNTSNQVISLFKIEPMGLGALSTALSALYGNKSIESAFPAIAANGTRHKVRISVSKDSCEMKYFYSDRECTIVVKNIELLQKFRGALDKIVYNRTQS